MIDPNFTPVPEWQRRRWPWLLNGANAVPPGRRPREGIVLGCGVASCEYCYELDPNPQDRPDYAPEERTS